MDEVKLVGCIYKGAEHPHEHCRSKFLGSICVHECVKAQAKAIAAKDGGIKYLRALVKSLADAIEKVLPENADCCHVESTLCKDGCMPNGKCNIDTIRALVTKARELENV